MPLRGYGMQPLHPVRCAAGTRYGLRLETVMVDDMFLTTSGASMRLVILDASRNNPPARLMQRTAATRTVREDSFADLHADLLGAEMLVAYAARTKMAVDGRKRTSSYTALETPPEIGLLFPRVRPQLRAVTHSEQRPDEHHRRARTSCLTRTLATSASTTVITAVPAEPWPADPPRPDPPERGIRELRMGVLDELAESGYAEPPTELGDGNHVRRGVVQDKALPCTGFEDRGGQGRTPWSRCARHNHEQSPPHSQPFLTDRACGAAHD